MQKYYHCSVSKRSIFKIVKVQVLLIKKKKIDVFQPSLLLYEYV